MHAFDITRGAELPVRHPVRAAAAAGAAGWRTAAAGARAAAAGAGALRRMPAKKAVAAAARAAMAVGAAPVAAGIVAAGAGAGWARRRGDRIRAEQADRARAEQARRAEQERADLAARTAQAVLDAQAGQTDQGGSTVPGDPVTLEISALSLQNECEKFEAKYSDKFLNLSAVDRKASCRERV